MKLSRLNYRMHIRAMGPSCEGSDKPCQEAEALETTLTNPLASGKSCLHSLPYSIATATISTNQEITSEWAEDNSFGSNLSSIREGEVLTADFTFNDEIGEIGSRARDIINTQHTPLNGDNEEQRPLPDLYASTLPREPEQNLNNNNHQKDRRKRKPHKCPTRTWAYLTIGSLNTNRGGSMQMCTKWEHVNQIVREGKVDILAVQETHLTTEWAEDLQTRTQWEETCTIELIQGRAIIVTIPWKQDKTLNIFAIYAPNETEAQINFWETLEEIFNPRNIPKPDVMLGDFNLVENKMDCDPPHKDPQAAVKKLQDFHTKYDLQDLWRRENPEVINFTYLQFQNTTNKSQSRIGCIYIKGNSTNLCYDWISRHSGIKSNHKLITVRIEDPMMPFIDKGRREGEQILNNLKKAIEKNELKEINPEDIHEKFKKTIQNKSREYA
ncbi:hypothetical protein BJ165DRAFT_1407849 [Panaeolus papilionaceus]|nr:hypothetical protein BJ165DRAFT_1407849 [Panaeolus papilionaceus]